MDRLQEIERELAAVERMPGRTAELRRRLAEAALAHTFTDRRRARREATALRWLKRGAPIAAYRFLGLPSDRERGDRPNVPWRPSIRCLIKSLLRG